MGETHPYGPPNVLSMHDLATAFYGAGFRGQSLVDIIAITMNESGGDATVVNDTPSTGDYSVGLVQNNYFGALGPERTAKYGSPQALAGDVNAQARAAFDLSGQGSVWSPWAADFNNGSIYKNRPIAQQAVDAFMGGATSPGSAGTPYTLPADTQNASSSKPASDVLWSFSIPLLGTIKFTQGNGRAVEGGLLLMAGSVVTLAGIALLMGRKVPTVNISGMSIPNPIASVKDRKLDREIDAGSKIPPPSRMPPPRRVDPSKETGDVF